VDEALEILRGQIAHYSDDYDLPEETAELSPDVSVEETTKAWAVRLAAVRENLRSPYLGALALAGEWDERREVLRRELDERREAADADSATATECNELAWRLTTEVPEDLRDAKAARKYAEKAVERLEVEGDEVAGLAWDTLARARQLCGDPVGAVEASRQSVDAFRRAGPDNYLDVSASAVETVRHALGMGDAAAGAAIDSAINALDEWFSDDMPKHVDALVDLGDRMANRGFLSLAEVPLRRAVEIAGEGSGEPVRRARLTAVSAFAYLSGRAGRATEASELADEALVLYRDLWVKGPIDWTPGLGLDPGSGGERERDAVSAKEQLVRILLTADRVEEAARLQEQVLCVRGRASDGVTPRLLVRQGRVAESEPFWWERLARMWTGGAELSAPWSMARFEAGYARCLMELGRGEEAEIHLRRAHARLLDWCGPASESTRRVERRLAALERGELDPWAPGGW
jgi:tetratricopeptide (TPR) repeat protein